MNNDNNNKSNCLYNGYLSWVNKYVERDDATQPHMYGAIFSRHT